MVVLNTCCIRENADQRLYGTLGRLKELVDAKPGLQIAVGGCLAQKDRERIQEKVGWVDVVFGTHNLTSAPGLLRRATTEGPVMEILDAPAPESGSNPLLGPRRRARGAVRGVGQHPDRVRQLLRLLHRAVGARSGGQPARRRHRGGGGAARPRRGDRGDAAGPERQLLRPRHHEAAARCSPICSAPSVRWTASGGSASPARTPRTCGPETIAAMAETPEVCEQLHLPLQSGSDTVLRAMRRGYTAQRYLERLRRGPRRHRRPGSDDRHHCRVPGRDGGGLRGHAGRVRRGRLRRRVHLHLLAAPGDESGRHGGRLRAPGCRRRTLRAPQDGGGPLARWPGTRPASAAARKRWSKGSAGATSRCSPAAPGRGSSSTSRPGRRPGHRRPVRWPG